jgi:hypothetical protein
MTPEEQAWYNQWKIVHGIAVSIVAERSRGNMAGVLALKPLLASNIEKLRSLSSAADAASLTQWDRFLLNVDSNVGTVLALPGLGIAKALAPVKWYLIGGAVLYALFVLSPMLKAAGRTR